jgi:protein disulfide-isomerase A1
MARTSIILLIAALALSFVYADIDESDVLVLNNDNFDETIKQHPLILVEFYAPWCGHCKHLAPEYAKAATALKGTVPLAKVDADAEQNRPLAGRFGIRGFPTIKFFRHGNPVDYQSERSAEAIIKYIKKQASPSIRELKSVDDVNNFNNEERVAVVGFFENTNSEEYTAFQTVAEELRENYIFGAVVGQSDVNKEFEVTSVPNLVLFKKFDEKKNVLDTTWDSLAAFVKKNSVPTIDEIGPHNYKSYAEADLPLAYLFVDLTVQGQLDQYLEVVNDLAKTTKGKLNWVYIDWSKYAKHSERLGLSGQTVPALAIEDMKQGTHYAFDESKSIEKDGVNEWVKDFLAGTLAPTIKSEEIPADNSGPVKVIVGKTFDTIVNDPTKDVLVEFYAPWCGHCKALAPAYEEVGEALKHVESVVIAKIDATANDVNPTLQIRGFPTIKLFKANDKANPIDYEGDRSKADFLTFLEENVHVKFDAPTVKDEL